MTTDRAKIQAVSEWPFFIKETATAIPQVHQLLPSFYSELQSGSCTSNPKVSVTAPDTSTQSNDQLERVNQELESTLCCVTTQNLATWS